MNGLVPGLDDPNPLGKERLKPKGHFCRVFLRTPEHPNEQLQKVFTFSHGNLTCLT